MLNPDLLALIEEHGWPLTKCSYVAAMFWPLDPDFPLHCDIVGRVPRDLPGELPESWTDLVFPDPISWKEGSNGRPPIPEPLIASVMRSHGLTRAEAIEELEKTLL